MKVSKLVKILLELNQDADIGIIGFSEIFETSEYSDDIEITKYEDGSYQLSN